ncbi:hypothetical protein BGW39_002437 [Mortierella sp. 14UC]|nr:hypothetical protein BGW39_002437 [Mortierella sp. 14UC]
MSASTRRILLLGVAVILIGSTSSSNVAYAQGEVQQQTSSSDPTGASAAHAAIRIGRGKTERTEDGDDGEVVSAAVVTDRRPLIAVPILVQVGAHGQEVESASSGGVRFELDHQVPPIEVLKQEAAQTGNMRRADTAAPAGVDQQPQEAFSDAVAVEDVNEAAPVVSPAETPKDVLFSDKTLSDSEPKLEAIPLATTSETTPSEPIAQAQVHPSSKPEEEAQAVAQEPIAQGPPEIKAESPKVPQGAQVPDKADQPPSTPDIELALLDMDPTIHAILDASAEAFGSPQIPPFT